MMVAVPRPGAGNPCAVQFAVIAVQFTARMAQFTPLLAHFVAVAHDVAVDGMGTAMANGGSGMGLSECGGQREESGCQQKLAHEILLQAGPHCLRPRTHNASDQLNRLGTAR